MNIEYCSQCGEKFKDIATHWRYNPSHRPYVSFQTKEILDGVVMGDGSVMRDGVNCGVRVSMKNKDAIKHLSDIVDIPSSIIKDGDIFRMLTCRHPDLNNYRDWYTKEGKVWPNKPLTPNRLKWLYVSDGHLNTTRSNKFIEINVYNEKENKEKIENMFRDIGIEVSNWNRGKVSFTKEDTKRMLRYMGEPVPGFEYKWGQ